MAAAAVTIFFIGKWVSAVIVLLFVLMVLLTVIPYFALMSERVSSSTWLKAYMQTLSRIPIVQLPVRKSYRLLLLKKPPELLSLIVQRRMKAEYWKRLHEDYQNISLKLVIVRGIASPDNLEMALQGLETHWRMECSDMIYRFIKLERLPDGTVKEDFLNADCNSKWLEGLRSAAEKLDNIVDQCEIAADLRVHIEGVKATLYNLEVVGSKLLNFLDARLQRTIKELDEDIESLRATFTASELSIH